MTPHQTIAVAIRLFAVWLALYFVRAAPAYHSGARDMSGSEFAGTFTIVFLAVVAVAFVVMWFFPRTLAKGILPRETTTVSDAATTDHWYSVGASLIGLWLLTDAIPALVRHAFVGILSHRISPAILQDANTYLDIIYYVTEFAIGVYLWLGAKGLRYLVMKARYGG